MVEPGDPGADPELQSTGREVVDGERLANEQPGWPQNGIGNQGADAHP